MEGVAPMRDQFISPTTEDTTEEVPYGYCHCGCGQRTEIAKRTYSFCGWAKGEPKPFLSNHRPKPAPERRVIDGETVVVIVAARGEEVIVDEVDADLARHSWHVHYTPGKDRHRVARCTTQNGKTVRYWIHRVVLERTLGRPVHPDMIGEHADEDPLNNRRGNLREASNPQNQANRRRTRADSKSPHRGVQRRGDRFYAMLQVDGERRFLGSFMTAEEAASVYRKAHAEVHGEFSPYSE